MASETLPNENKNKHSIAEEEHLVLQGKRDQNRLDHQLRLMKELWQETHDSLPEGQDPPHTEMILGFVPQYAEAFAYVEKLIGAKHYHFITLEHVKKCAAMINRLQKGDMKEITAAMVLDKVTLDAIKAGPSQ